MKELHTLVSGPYMFNISLSDKRVSVAYSFNGELLVAIDQNRDATANEWIEFNLPKGETNDEQT